MLGLSGKCVLVTGASKGIGAATALLFARLGARVAVHTRAEETEATAIAEQVRQTGPRAEVLLADLSRWDEGERLVAAAESRIGPLDAVVLNHGIWKAAPIDTMNAEQYELMLDTNLRGFMSVTGAAARRMKTRRAGRMVGTPMTQATMADPVEGAKVLATIPLGRVAQPEEIAWPIAFLASERASFVTGEIFNVNGGAVLVG